MVSRNFQIILIPSFTENSVTRIYVFPVSEHVSSFWTWYNEIYSRLVNLFLWMCGNQNIFKYLSHPMMIHVHHIIWVVSWKQIANFVSICEHAALTVANDANDANAKKARYKIKITDSAPILYNAALLVSWKWSSKDCCSFNCNSRLPNWNICYFPE